MTGGCEVTLLPFERLKDLTPRTIFGSSLLLFGRVLNQ